MFLPIPAKYEAKFKAANSQLIQQPGYEPKKVVLCGSTKFYKEYAYAAYRLSLEGFVVLSCGCFGHMDNEAIYGFKVELTEQDKQLLDHLHKRKIDMADIILIICPENYIGTSTQSEIEYCDNIYNNHKPVYYWRGIGCDVTGIYGG
jgi:hypothetical protein